MSLMARRHVYKALGIVFLVAGIAGLVLPFFQGILFILIGLYLVTIDHPVSREWVRKHLGRVPSALAMFDSCDRHVRKWFKIDV